MKGERIIHMACMWEVQILEALENTMASVSDSHTEAIVSPANKQT